jgi:hypothetical protein
MQRDRNDEIEICSEASVYQFCSIQVAHRHADFRFVVVLKLVKKILYNATFPETKKCGSEFQRKPSGQPRLYWIITEPVIRRFR